MIAPRAGIFFAGLVIAMVGAFWDLRDTVGWILGGPTSMNSPKAPWVIPLEIAIDVTLTAMAALLVARGHVMSRLPVHRAWYVLIVVGAVLVLANLYYPVASLFWRLRGAHLLPYFGKPLLFSTLVVMMLHLAAMPGSSGQTTPFPTYRAFLGFSLLVALSFQRSDFYLSGSIADLLNKRTPWYAHLIVALVTVAALMLYGRIARRRVYRTPAASIMAAGFALFVVVALALPLGATLLSRDTRQTLWIYTRVVPAASVISHFLVFAGAFLLVARLAPAERKA